MITPMISITAPIRRSRVARLRSRSRPVRRNVRMMVAALSGDKNAVAAESADLLFHLLVVLQARGVKLDEVYAELERRTGQSGLEEKAARKG